ncbi:hypothetical protein HPB52_011793 [Rhipicephalus sanguineus]|uniref:Gamma-glutamyltransferase n=1 Tax=Rhipicephalus sanguineus TaxID=34632 RepID=A0A9D4SQV1_RHISA|nr:hypothetical protein HPB52_011793 [Rhipicephalus sanguineus]
MMYPPLRQLSPDEQAKCDERWRRRTRRNVLFFVLTSVSGLAALAALWIMVPQLVLVIWPPGTNVPLGNYSRWGAVTIKECAGVPRRVFAEHGTVGDVAVALTLCTCVALPIHCGLGGGVLALYYNNATGQSWFIDGREESPSGASQSFYAASSTTEIGILSIAVPGQLRGLVKLHDLTGNNLAWRTLFREAIDLANNGFVINKQLMQDFELYRSAIENNRALRCDHFYEREFAQQWHKELADSGSLIKLTDILNYKARQLPPLRTELDDDLVLVTAPPPTTGAITATICGIVKKWYASHTPVDDASFYHVLAEAFKFGFGQRPIFGDYNFTDAQKVAEMINPVYAKALAERIQEHGVLPSYSEYWADPEKVPSEQHYVIKSSTGGAVPIIIWAPNGDVVALETSLNSVLGSQVLSETKGIIYNNLMNDFDIPNQTNLWGFPGSLSSNLLGPSRRPVTSLAPVFLFRKGALVAVAMGVGGGFAITGTAQGQQSYLRFQSHDVHLQQQWTGTVVAMTWEAGRIYVAYDFRNTVRSNTIVGEWCV